MKIEIEIPKEFERDFTSDKFVDFFERVIADIDCNGACGKYEKEIAEMFIMVLKNGIINNQPQVQPIVKTQADRIRNMSDEELAEFLEKIASGNRSVIGTDCGNDKCESWKCTECILTYLQSKAKEV